jgi:hypothetical protein
MFEQMLLAQRQISQAAAAQEAAQFAAARSASAQQAQQQIAAENLFLEKGIRKAARRPVTLGTLLTSPQGLLGNPVLSGTKLGG